MAEDVSITTFTLNQKKNNKANLWISTDLYLNIFFLFSLLIFSVWVKSKRMQRSELLKAWSRFSMSRHLKVKCLIPSFKISLKDMTTTGYAVFQITNLVWISNSDFRLVDKTLKRNILKVLTYVYLCIWGDTWIL